VKGREITPLARHHRSLTGSITPHASNFLPQPNQELAPESRRQNLRKCRFSSYGSGAHHNQPRELQRRSTHHAMTQAQDRTYGVGSPSSPWLSPGQMLCALVELVLHVIRKSWMDAVRPVRGACHTSTPPAVLPTMSDDNPIRETISAAASGEHPTQKQAHCMPCELTLSTAHSGESRNPGRLTRQSQTLSGKHCGHRSPRAIARPFLDSGSLP
jgi:hypothetical protein